MKQLVYIGSEDTESTYYSGEEDVETFELWAEEAPEILENQAVYLDQNGYDVDFKLFPGVAHDVTEEMYDYKVEFIKNNL